MHLLKPYVHIKKGKRKEKRGGLVHIVNTKEEIHNDTWEKKSKYTCQVVKIILLFSFEHGASQIFWVIHQNQHFTKIFW